MWDALDREHLVAVADHAVDVLAEMGVRVEDLGAGRQLGERERCVALEQVVRTADRVHPLSLGRLRGVAPPSVSACPAAFL